MNNFIINIGRQFGSGGHIIGERLAMKMGFAFYDKELIRLASKESGLGRDFFEKADEKPRSGPLSCFFGMRAGVASEDMFNNYMSNDMFFKIQSDVIQELASKESCVFVGRCADYILRDNPLCTNIFITAELEDRIRRVAERQPDIAGEKIKDFIEKTDKKRENYYNYYTNKTWGSAKSYHLSINSSAIGIDKTVELIYHFVRERFGLD